MAKKLIILSDYGLDDAVAAIHILDNRELFGDIDIVAIGGNSPAEVSFSNIKKLLKNYNKNLDGVRVVSTNNIEQVFVPLSDIHGTDGLGDLFSGCKDCPVPVLEYEAFKREIIGDEVLLSLGPCTLTEQLLDAYPNMECVLMAGVTDETPNYNGYEFNQALNVPSYNACVCRAVTATLDTCRHKKLNFVTNGIRGNGFISVLINRAVELAILRHPDNCFIYDYVAALYLTNKEKFTTQKIIDRWGVELTELVYIG